MIHKDCPEMHKLYKGCVTCDQLFASDRKRLTIMFVILAILTLALIAAMSYYKQQKKVEQIGQAEATMYCAVWSDNITQCLREIR